MTPDRIYYSKDAEAHAMRRMTIRTALFLTVGLGIGALMALLMAPSSGKKIRKDLVQSVEESVHTGRESVEPLIKRLEEQINELRKSVEDRVKASFHPN